MMNAETTMVTLAQVRGAFMLAQMQARARAEDDAEGAACVWAIEAAAVDVMRILDPDADGDGQETKTESRDEGAMCPACGQTLAEIRRTRFACPKCYEAFGDAAVDAAVLPF
jgi:protein-arginine kinase activator protein McsA